MGIMVRTFEKIRRVKIDFLFIFLLFVISVWGLKSLFGGPYYTSQDGIHQIARLYHFKLALKDGVFPPRWANQAVYGFGYPLFEFNYHLPWYAAMPLIFLRVNLFDIIKILHFVAYFFSGVFMYLFLKELVKNKFFSFMGAFLFLVSPYRFVNIYVRNAMGEVFAMMFFPLVFYFLIKLAGNLKISNAIFLSVALYGIILSHAISFLLFLPSLLVFGLYCFWLTKNKRKFLWRCVAVAVLFLGLSAYYLLPALIERSYTIFDVKFQQIYGRELLDFKRIIYSSWGYSGNGNLPENVMSFQFGIPNWIVAVMGVVVITLMALTGKIKEARLMIISLFLIVFSLFLSVKPALPFWHVFAKIFPVDFPWKFIGLAVFWSAIILSLLFSQIKFRLKYLFAFLFLVFILYANRNHIRVNKYVSFDIPSAAFYEKTTNTEDEYLPKWVNADYLKDEKNMHLKNKERIVVSGAKKYRVSQVTDRTHEFSYLYNGARASQLVKKIYFPGWVVKVNGKPIDFSYEPSGFFNFKMGGGTSRVQIIYEGTPLVKISNIISLITWGAAIVFLLWKKFIKSRI